MMRRPAFLLSAALAILAAPAAIPQQAAGSATAYTVEVVVFRNGGGEGGEDLGESQRSLSEDSDTGTGSDAGRNSRLIQVLPAGRYRLGDVVSRLNASGGHRTVAHAAWLQTASAWNVRSGIPVEQLGLGTSGLSGVVYLERGQYLHLGLNLTFAAAGGGRYSMLEIRRVKLNERHYFDHPGFGVIAIVSPATAAP
ncbi:MAG: CsiV family protein [Pseudomonadota bacterium]